MLVAPPPPALATFLSKVQLFTIRVFPFAISSAFILIAPPSAEHALSRKDVFVMITVLLEAFLKKDSIIPPPPKKAAFSKICVLLITSVWLDVSLNAATMAPP